MNKVVLKCSNCGGDLHQVETQKDTYICLHCGSKEIIKDEASTTNFYVNQNITKTIYGSEKASEEDYYKLIENSEKYIRIEDYKRAISIAKKATKIDEGNYLAWWILVKAKLLYNILYQQSNILILYTENNIENDYNKAYNFAEESVRNQIKSEYEELCKKWKNEPEEDLNFVKANFESVNINHVIITLVVLNALLLAVSIIFIITSLISKEYGIISVITPCLCSFIVVCCILSEKIKCKKIVGFIYSKDKVEFKEILKFCQETIIIYKTAKWLGEDNEIENLKSKIASYIRNGFLTGYQINKDIVEKVQKTN